MAPTAATAAVISVTLLLALSLVVNCTLELDTAVQHRCQSGPQTITTNESFLLLLKHPFYHYLKPNQRCEIRVQPRPVAVNSHRQQQGPPRIKWLISVVNASLQAYAASAVFTEDNGLTVLANLTADTDQLDSYQFATSTSASTSSSTSSSNFSVSFVTTDLPELFSTGLVLLVEPVVRCPRGWLDTGIGCYGLLGGLATQPLAEAACARIGGSLSNGVYNNDHIGQILASLLMTSSSAGGDTYWVGIVSEGGTGRNFSYGNGFINPHPIEHTGSCSLTASAIGCNCVVYQSQSGKFLSQRCSSSHRFVCTMPHPGFEPHCGHQKCEPDHEVDRRHQNCDCGGWKVALAFMGGLAFVALVVVACFCGCVLRRRGGGI